MQESERGGRGNEWFVFANDKLLQLRCYYCFVLTAGTHQKTHVRVCASSHMSHICMYGTEFRMCVER